MLSYQSESRDASPKRPTYETERFAGNADPINSEGDRNLVLGESTTIGAGIDLEKCGALPDDPRSRNKERDPDKATRVSSSEKLNGSVLKRGGSRANSF